MLVAEKILQIAPAAPTVERAERIGRGGRDDRFERLMAEAGGNQDSATERTSRAQRQEQRQATEVAEEAPQNYEPSTEAAYYEAAAYAPAIQPEIMLEAIAEALAEAPAQLSEYLAKAEIAPADLVEPTAIAKLLQTVLEYKEPVELLSAPEVPQLYKAVNEAVKALVAEAELANYAEQKPTEATPEAVSYAAEVAKPVVKAQEMPTNVLVSVENGDTIVAEATELAVDGEVVTATAQSETEQGSSQQSTGGREPLQHAEPVQEAPITDMSAQVTAATRAEATAPTQTAQPAAPAPTYVNTADVIEQIMGQVRVVSTGGAFTEMRMTLRPESLGDIVLRVVTQNGIVMAQFEAESQRVKEALEADMNQLRDALTEAGIAFSELNVNVRQDNEQREALFEQGRNSTRARADEINESVVKEETHSGFINITA
jgi:flagellar hook-length control protein FliK